MLLADVCHARANDHEWRRSWLSNMTAHVHETVVCRGRVCTADGVRPRYARRDGHLPIVVVAAPPTDNVLTDLATLLARFAAPKRHGFDPICDGLSCERCTATGVRCPCPAQSCGGKIAMHGMQPYETRKGIWPPPRGDCNIAATGW